MMWIKEHMISDIDSYTPELTAELLLKYMELFFAQVKQFLKCIYIGCKLSLCLHFYVKVYCKK